ncbi:hypothetical protein L798_09230 [Zootermopsis nevadensis]|uniref:Uncharacterized protein n=2 Tax=Zootermopsis nevadensis TaxID=136037 RepID=A0A067RB09_ZOONE|nr:hypothetical protein L798_09230 [Zootermopsis nevadensis]
MADPPNRPAGEVVERSRRHVSCWVLDGTCILVTVLSYADIIT